MRVRRLDADGDYLIGRGSADFWINNVPLVAQNIQTRLLLWEGEWFLDKFNGTPWSQEILGYGTTAIRDQLLKARILETPGVLSIVSFDSSVNPVTRKYTVQGKVLTQFSTQPVSFGPVNL
jgi:hypothetical protein